jgi:sphinganine C4-monooxygenase
MSYNTTESLLPQQILFLSSSLPVYYSPRPQLVPGVPENYLSLASPILAYWVLSLIFHGLDISNWQWLDKYRIHESEEMKSRNKVSKYDVILAVIFQHVLQTALGLWWLDDSPESGGSAITHLEPMMRLAPTLRTIFLAVVGEKLGTIWWNEKADKILYFVYWWGIPVLQIVFGM